MSHSVDNSASRRDDLKPSVSRVVVFRGLSVRPVRSCPLSLLLLPSPVCSSSRSVVYLDKCRTMSRWRDLNRGRIRAAIGSVAVRK